MGEWVYKDELNHKCPRPSGTFKTKAGDIWRCDCGLMWKVKSSSYKGDQRDSWYEIQWEQFVGEVPNQQKGGYATKSDPGVTSWRDR